MSFKLVRVSLYIYEIISFMSLTFLLAVTVQHFFRFYIFRFKAVKKLTICSGGSSLKK